MDIGLVVCSKGVPSAPGLGVGDECEHSNQGKDLDHGRGRGKEKIINQVPMLDLSLNF